ncbi:Nitrite reductase [NAD(P)H] small subunit [Raoultella terrigena]|uniref:Nitrite reductase [NAD(P)H] small subunit n=1 Tax=Raoultella terrigena TaxID=577 RepID=A0A3P8KJK4_RAOTE|nr:Nitrite reductase [NAD(P)H] small subunit [Raoultella terrigena]
MRYSASRSAASRSRWRRPCGMKARLRPVRGRRFCDLEAIPAEAGIGARLGERQIALFRFGEQIYALDNLEPGSDANVLSRGILGDAGGEPIVISPLYKQRIRLRDGRACDGGEQAYAPGR